MMDMHLESEQVGQKGAVGVKLAKALADLKTKLAIEEEFELVWLPSVQGPLSGEIKEKRIFIYEAEEAKALQTLIHELVDYLVTTRIVQPLVKLVNLLVKSTEANIYQAKEEVIEKLVSLYSQTTGDGGAAGIHRSRAEPKDSKVKGRRKVKEAGDHVG